MNCFPVRAAGIAFATLASLAALSSSSPALAQAAAPSDQALIVHVLNRITFGPRPGDVERVRQMGLRNYIDQQLHPESIDDSAVEQELQNFELLQMTPQQLENVFLDDTKRALKKAKEFQAQQNAAMNQPPAAPGGDTTMEQTAAVSGQQMAEATTPGSMPVTGPGTYLNNGVTNNAPAGAFGGGPGLIDRVKQWKSVAAIGQLEKAKLIRAVDSPRQLQEVLVDFWTNHFNIDMKKGLCRVLKITDDKDVIRPHILGRFRDMLEASATSPAMLIYLDNAQNSLQRNLTPLQQRLAAMYINMVAGNFADQIPKPGKKVGGINENYAREIMELHTLGVDGGYTQKDVEEVARCFTGWTLNRKTGDFVFRPRQHDEGEKFVLGHDIPAGGGMQDGETVLDILASSPSTAHHLSLELCQRFISDTPPEDLVKRVAGVYLQTNGDLRAVTSAILTSPEFLSPAYYQAKIKSPLEFAVSAVRATESTLRGEDPPPFDRLRATVEGAAVMGRGKAADKLSQAKRQSLNWHIYELGEPLFACTPPTGYKEISRIWVSPGALIERLNFAMALTEQKVADVKFNAKNVLGQTDLDHPDAVLDQCATALLQGNLSPSTRKVLEQAALPAPGESKTVDPARLIALILGSPEFQRK